MGLYLAHINVVKTSLSNCRLLIKKLMWHNARIIALIFAFLIKSKGFVWKSDIFPFRRNKIKKGETRYILETVK